MAISTDLVLTALSPQSTHPKELIMGGFDFQSLIEMAKALIPMITQIVQMFR